VQGGLEGGKNGPKGTPEEPRKWTGKRPERIEEVRVGEKRKEKGIKERGFEGTNFN
jgi:hypothetical protein